jgi:hypothetical protein
VLNTVGDAEICDDYPTTLVDSPFGGMVMLTGYEPEGRGFGSCGGR